MKRIPFPRKVPVIALTPLGEEQAERFEGTGLTLKSIAKLKERGAMTLTQFAQEMSLNYNQARVVANTLIDRQLVRRIG